MSNELEIKVIREIRKKGAFVPIYGVPGVGKTTKASQAPNPLLLDLEGGADRVDVPRTQRLHSWKDFIDAMRYFYMSEFESGIIDSGTAAEVLCRKHVCEKNGWKSIEQPGYGKGYVCLQEEWERLHGIIAMIRDKGKNIIMTCHETIVAYLAPDSDTYDRYTLNLHKRLTGVTVGAADAVLFMQYDSHTVTDSRTDRKRAVGSGERVIRCQEMPSYIAKNRFNLEQSYNADDPALFNTIFGE